MTQPSGTLRSSVACSQCGYDLRGLRRDGDCPECGASIHATLAAVPAPRPLLPTRWLLVVAFACLGVVAACDWAEQIQNAPEWAERVSAVAMLGLIGTTLTSYLNFWRWPTMASLVGMVVVVVLFVCGLWMSLSTV